MVAGEKQVSVVAATKTGSPKGQSRCRSKLAPAGGCGATRPLPPNPWSKMQAIVDASRPPAGPQRVVLGKSGSAFQIWGCSMPFLGTPFL